MREKIDISFLTLTGKHLEESLSLIKDYTDEVPTVRSIRYTLNLMHHAVKKIIASGTSSEDDILYMKPNDFPELLWIRYTSAQIVKTMDLNKVKNPFDPEMRVKMEEIYYQFDNIYQSFVAE